MLDGTKVLIVEDDRLVAVDLATILEEAHGVVVGPAYNVADARQLARGHPVDVALLDVRLSDGEVTPVLEALCARRVPAVIYTGAELPERLRDRHPELTVLHKPALPARIVGEVWKARRVAERALAASGTGPEAWRAD